MRWSIQWKSCACSSQACNGMMRVAEFEEATGVRLDDEVHENVETLGGLLAVVLGRFPEVGEEIVVGGRRFRVETRDGLRVEKVRCLPLVTATTSAPATSKQPTDGI